ncbi:hypothetical protein HNQ51_003221 [Inhella inkyongensis]|uniref:YfiR family protein n=1 Tax=Inhella inkyongensis TaxID=392593 RepID=A0A840SC14_9BURK|nr:YfiR family protein [Inhella inkyongensis]MBB5205890.1 hypothetical protein [Inhella inkyongensis]
MKARAALCLAAALATSPLCQAQLGVDADAQLRAAFIYRFAQFTQWPADSSGMNLCMAGPGGMEEALRQLGGRLVAGQPLNFRVVDSPREAASCQVLVLGQSDPATLRRWLQGLGDAPVLVVGLVPEALRAGVSIALLAEPQGLAFSINHSEAKRRGLALSGQMLKLAREVR